MVCAMHQGCIKITKNQKGNNQKKLSSVSVVKLLILYRKDQIYVMVELNLNVLCMIKSKLNASTVAKQQSLSIHDQYL